MLRVASVAKRLLDLGYRLTVWEEAGSEPQLGSKTFSDIIPSFAGAEYGSWRLYRHQEEAIEALREGKNVVLTAKTGSGKTEAWALAALAEGWRVLALYPTLALAADQIYRLEKYYEAAGYGKDAVVRLDRPTIDKLGYLRLAKHLAKARVVVTNPAFLMAELKRVASGRGILSDFLTRLDLIVVDELDFYGPRAAHLILAMLEIISKYLAAQPPRIVILSATIGNPHELASLLTRLTGRESVVIEGNPRKPPNKYILVLGKEIDALYNFVRKHLDYIRYRIPWIAELVEDEDEFAERAYEVYEALEAIGLRPPRPALDPAEVLSAILEEREDGVTLVFTRSIRSAERLFRELLERSRGRYSRLVATHHHLVPKQRREEIEKAARQGRLRMIITVRTLAQGIDIGTVVRVVHVGLPMDTREFHQREGRKGRRREIPFTESIIIPQGLWDHRLLRAGAEAVKEWINLHLEKLYVNPRNKYALLFRALWKLLRRIRLEREELELLSELGLVTYKHTLMGDILWPSEKGLRVWSNLGFYEYGPPYGYKRVLRRDGEERVPEEVSIREAVERLQPGCFDYTTNAIVVDVDPSKLRIVEEPVERAVERHEWLRRAAGEYENIKLAWRERPNLVGDLIYGRISTSVQMRVEAPAAGFGVLLELPIGVKWIVESRRPRISRTGRVFHDVSSIELEVPVKGKYMDFTYGYVLELPGETDTLEIEAGLLYLQVFLRLNPRYAIPLGLLRYAIVPVGFVKRVHVWEDEAAGLIEGLDWARIAREVEGFKPTPLALTLIAALDPQVYNAVVDNEALLNRLPALAARIARLLANVRILEVMGVRVECPKPSPEHKIAVLMVMHERVDAGRLYFVDVIGWFDGSEKHVEVYEYEPTAYRGYEVSTRLYAILSQLFSRGFRVYHYGQERLLTNLLAGAYMGYMIVDHAKREGRLIDLHEEVRKRVGDVPLAALGDVGRRAARRTERYADELREAMKRAREERSPKPVAEVMKKLVESTLDTLYCLALAVEKGVIERVEKGK